MRRSLLFATLALSLFLGSFASAQTCVRTDILVQGGTIVPGNINRYGTVVGYFQPSDPNGPHEEGFRWNNGVFNTYQFPGANDTEFAASNDKGQIVGSYYVWANYTRSPHSGFIYQNGTFTQIDYPGATTTTLTGINNAGDLVGTFTVTATGWHNHAFLKHGSTWTELVPPGGTDAVPTAISNTGEVLGNYSNGSDGVNFRYKDGQYTTFSPKPEPNVWRIALGINSYGSIVGQSADGRPAYTWKNGIYYTYNYPKSTAAYTLYTGINDLGDRVGLAYLKPEGTQGFVMKCR